MKTKIRFILCSALFTLLPAVFLFINDIAFAYKRHLSVFWIYASMFSRKILFPLGFCAAGYCLVASVLTTRGKDRGTRTVLWTAAVCLALGKTVEAVVLNFCVSGESVSHVLPYVWSTAWMWIFIFAMTLVFHLKQKRMPG